jgi:hypothetical protein
MITLFDQNGTRIDANPGFIELQWNRKFNGFGEFSLYMPADKYDRRAKYIQNSGRPETGIVQKVVYEQKTEGDFVTLSGYFIEALLNWGALWKDKAYMASGAANVTTEINRLMRDCLTQTLPPTITGYVDPEVRATNAQLYEGALAANATVPSSISYNYPAGTPCGEALLGLLNSEGYSLYAGPYFNDTGTGPLLGLVIHPYTGTDKHNEVIFGKPYNNVDNVEYVLDESAEKSEYVVVQDIDAAQAATYSGVISINTSEGVKKYIALNMTNANNVPSAMGGAMPMKVLYSSANSDTSATQSDIQDQMRRAAQIDMLDNYKLQTITVSVIQNGVKYLEDYDLGDTVSLIVRELNRTYVAQIMEVYEVHSDNKVDVQIVLGTPRRSAGGSGSGSGATGSGSGSGNMIKEAVSFRTTNAEWTAPSDGTLVSVGRATTTMGNNVAILFIQDITSTAEYVGMVESRTAGDYMTLTLPVIKGHRYKVTSAQNWTHVSQYFYHS